MSPRHMSLDKVHIEVVRENPLSLLGHKINAKGREDKDDAFFVADLGNIVRKWKLWKSELPRVEPHYAVKCNDDPAVLSILSHLGAGFDCASKSEIQRVLELNVSPSRIVYANPCKQTSHVRYAAKNDVGLMTFDNETELHKIKAVYPDAELVIRILPPEDTKCQCQLGMKYGVHPRMATNLLRKAYDLDLNVVGVSFHVGSGCYDVTAFSAAVASARTVFDMGKEVGYHFTLLDIGGGFPGQRTAKISFEEICATLRPALDMYFPENMGVRIISEPGRFFAAASFHLATNIIAKRALPRDAPDLNDAKLKADDEPSFMYYLNDGVYGSFNCLLFDHAEVIPSLVDPEDYKGDPSYACSIWGPTCDGLDCIKEQWTFPELQQGDWIQFEDMGAYTMAAASTFNGMPKPRCYYMMLEKDWVALHDASVKTRAGLKKEVKGRQDADMHAANAIVDCISTLTVQ